MSIPSPHESLQVFLQNLAFQPLSIVIIAVAYAFFTVMVLMYIAFAFLPMLCLWNKRLAYTKKSALYEKGALHLTLFGMIFYGFHGVLALGDYTFNGIIIQYLRPFSLQIPFLFVGLLLMFGAVIFWILRRIPKGAHAWLYWVNFICGMGIFKLTVTMAWIFMRRIQTQEEVGTIHAWVQSFLNSEFILFALFCLLSGLMAAHVFSLTFFATRRHRDDFGRDYYTLMFLTHAKRGAFLGVLMLLPALGLLLLISMTPYRLEWLLEFFRQYGNIGPEGILTGFITIALGLPFATIGLYFLGCSDLPLQRRSFAFYSLIFLFVGVFAVYSKLFY